ncbi:MAG: tetratricopeptide repeat protein [Bacteroidia bacterium]|nr:tetratricopeptide repeat protein [Bacteroidia bacterium]
MKLRAAVPPDLARCLRVLLALCWVWMPVRAHARQGLSPGAEALMAAARPDTAQIRSWLDLAYVLETRAPDSALLYYEATAELSRQLSYALGEAKALHYSGLVLADMGRYPEAESLYYQAIPHYRRASYLKGEAACHNGIANLYNYRGDFANAEKHYLIMVDLLQGQDDRRSLAIAYHNLGGIMSDSRNFAQALRYHQMALDIHRAQSDTPQIAKSYNDLGVMYARQNDTAQARLQFEEAFRMASLADSMDPKGMLLICQNLADSYRQAQRYTEALDKAAQAQQIAEEIQAAYELAGIYFIQGLLYADLRQLPAARSYILRSLEIARQTNSYRLLADAYWVLKEIEKQAGNYRAAVEYFEIFRQYQDSVMSIEQRKAVADLDARYQTRLKDEMLARSQLEIGQQQAELRTKNQWIAAGFAGLGLASAVALLIWITYRQKQRLDAQRLDSMEQAQRLNISRALISGEERARTEIARTLHDSIGGLLAAARHRLGTAVARSDEPALALLDQAARDVRALSHQLMPETLERFGLEEALRQYLRSIAEGSGLEVAFQPYGMEAERLPAEIELLVYRIVQELAANVVKHAGARHLLIQLNRHAHLLSLTVEDDGQGFDPAAGHAAAGMGLSSIRSRIDYVGGTFDIAASPGAGVSVGITLSLAQPLSAKSA